LQELKGSTFLHGKEWLEIQESSLVLPDVQRFALQKINLY